MKIRITGNLRDVANSAWISTLDEIKAMSRTDEDAARVVNFLVENKHTSPFEAVTISFDYSSEEELSMKPYMEDNYSRFKQSRTDPTLDTLSIDLLNFMKVTIHHGLFCDHAWTLFSEALPDLAALCEKFKPLGGQILTPDAGPTLGQHNMSVELVSLHDEGDLELSRATWRLACPLSIAVQILRHRKSSPNMSSGRYRTLRQDILLPAADCVDIFDKVGLSLEDYLDSVKPIIGLYRQTMKEAKAAKDLGKITNPEYKRLREFARFILPEGRITEMYITYYLDDFYNNYLQLRNSEHAQTEHIWIAQEMEKTLDAKRKTS